MILGKSALFVPDTRFTRVSGSTLVQNVWHNFNKGMRTIQTLYSNIHSNCSTPPHIAPNSKSPPFEDTLGTCAGCAVKHIGQLEKTKNIPVRNKQSCIYYLKHTNKLCMCQLFLLRTQPLGPHSTILVVQQSNVLLPALRLTAMVNTTGK